MFGELRKICQNLSEISLNAGPSMPAALLYARAVAGGETPDTEPAGGVVRVGLGPSEAASPRRD